MKLIFQVKGNGIKIQKILPLLISRIYAYCLMKSKRLFKVCELEPDAASNLCSLKDTVSSNYPCYLRYSRLKLIDDNDEHFHVM